MRRWKAWYCIILKPNKQNLNDGWKHLRRISGKLLEDRKVITSKREEPKVQMLMRKLSRKYLTVTDCFFFPVSVPLPLMNGRKIFNSVEKRVEFGFL